MSFEETINAYFVIDEHNDEEPVELSLAFSTLKEHIRDDQHIKWISQREGFTLITSGQLTKKDVFVLSKFEGELFEQLQTTKCLIVGPKCLLNCLHKYEMIPPGPSPIYNTAMNGLLISASGLGAEEKDKIRQLISWMGGQYFQNLGRSITHLISNTIKSTKYEQATLNDIPVMHVDWVQKVWEMSCTTNGINATDTTFDKYKLPVFYGVNITCSGLTNNKKLDIIRLVEENGGTYHGAFKSHCTDIVITEKNKANSEKYKAAIRYKKDVLTPEWIFDSVTKGFALPTKKYQVTTMKVSTPTKLDHTISDNTQLSDISRISFADSGKRGDLTVNDSVCSTLSGGFSAPKLVSQKAVAKSASNASQHKSNMVYGEICPKKAKKAGTFLDGCCIYLSGFENKQKDKLNRILNAGGATRYDEINENLTHIIVDQLDEAEFRTWQKNGLLSSVNIVRLDWLQQSIAQKQPASENLYKISLPTNREPDAPSPSSKRTLRSMSRSFKQPNLPKKQLFAPDNSQSKEAEEKLNNNTPDEDQTMRDEEDDLISQYCQDTPVALPPPAMNESKEVTPLPVNPIENIPLPSKSSPAKALVPLVPAMADSEMSSGIITMEYENLDFLRGMTVYINREHFFDELYSQLACECEAAHGNVVEENFRDPVDYAFVSFEKTLDIERLPVKAKYVVTELYMEECMKQNKLVPIEYFHKHVPTTAASSPLKGMVVVVSLYSGLERDFIDGISQLLGAAVNKTFIKRERPLLVCPSPEGSKYEGAIKWQYPVVNSKWLVDCAETGQKLPYDEYLVGNSALDFPPSPALQEKNTNTISAPSPKVTPQRTTAMETDAAENVSKPTTPTIVTPLRNKRVSELAGPSRKSLSMESPKTPTNGIGRPSYNFELMDQILAEIEDEDERECLRDVILEMKNNQTPELERIRRQACTPINRKLPTPKGIPDFCTTPEFEKRISEEFERRWRLPTKKLKPNTPIEEIRKRLLRATCKVYGIEYGDSVPSTPTIQGSSSSETTPITGVVPRARTSFQEKMAYEDCIANTSTQSPELKQISEYLRNCESNRRSSSRTKKPESLDTTDRAKMRGVRFESEKFGGHTEEMVTWRDPSEFTISRKNKSPSMQYTGTPRFSISCSSDDVRQEIIDKIQKLQGEVSENLANYDPECTHFLCERPNRGEKMLGCIASGKWVLGLAYIEECFAQNAFLNEELFEWGNPKAFNLPDLPKEETVIAQAAHRWRTQLSTKKDQGAFSGFKAILRISDRHKESLKNVIKAGRGDVVQIESPYAESNLISRATHCFVDIKKAPLTAGDYEALVKNGIKVLSQIYINAYLMHGKDADSAPYTVQM